MENLGGDREMGKKEGGKDGGIENVENRKGW